MNAAFLFDAYYEPYEPNYYHATRRLIFENGLIQAANRHMKMSHGDIRIPNGAARERAAYREAIYLNHGGLTAVHADRLRDTYGRAEVSALMFENMPRDLALRLHEALTPDEGYLGAIEVNLAYGPHLALFRNSIILGYRLKGRMARAFYSMGTEDGRDPYDITSMQGLGFTDVDWEDKGARKTIFDNFDTLTHFQEVSIFRETVTPFLPGGEDDAYELAMVLEDLNPVLFNALGAASVALYNALHAEHAAQAAVSGRRYLEQLADALFPARSELYNGRNVGSAEYKNRLWAFLTDSVDKNDPRLAALGGEIDRLVGEWNAGLHGNTTKDRVLQALADTARLSASLLALNPEAARQPYAPFEPAMRRFLAQPLAAHEDDEDNAGVD